MIRLLIVDDHPVARRGAQVLVEDFVVLSEVAHADTAQEALRLARKMTPDLILLDLQLDNIKASHLCGELLGAVPSSRVVVFTAFADIAEIRECLVAGAHGCILKDADASDIAESLQDVLRGEIVLDPRVSAELARKYVNSLSPSQIQLTERERDVLKLLADGLSNRDVASKLFLAESTVKGYVASVLEKLGVESRLQAVVRAQRDGLLDP